MAVVKNTPNSSSIGYPTGDERSQDYLESRLNIELNLMGNNGDMGLETRLIAVSWKLDEVRFLTARLCILVQLRIVCFQGPSNMLVVAIFLLTKIAIERLCSQSKRIFDFWM